MWKRSNGVLVALGFFLISFPTPSQPVSSGTAARTEIVLHGGGCRKSSPPGLCCHMDHKTGIVHCH